MFFLFDLLPLKTLYNNQLLKYYDKSYNKLYFTNSLVSKRLNKINIPFSNILMIKNIFVKNYLQHGISSEERNQFLF